MKYAIIYRHPFLRSQSLLVDADSLEAIRVADIDPEEAFVEWVVDFESKEIIRAGMTVDGRIIEVPDGDYGEGTPTEYFEKMEFEE